MTSSPTAVFFNNYCVDPLRVL